MLTYRTLDRFEAEHGTKNFDAEQIGRIEFAAYVANMNRCGHPEWTEADVYTDFCRVLKIERIELEQVA